MANTPKRFIKAVKLILLNLAILTVLSLWLLYIGYNIGASFMQLRNLEKIDVSLDASQFPHEEISFKSTKGDIELKGVLFTPVTKSNKTIILVHGFNENRMMDGRTEILVKHFIPKGYNILAFDLRGQGESEGNLISFGCYEKYDVLGAVNYLKTRGMEGEKIALLGYSMGAVTVIESGAMDSRVDAVIADSPFCDLEHYLINDVDTIPDSVTEFPEVAGGSLILSTAKHIPINKSIIKILSKIYDINVTEISPLNAIKNAPQKPIFLIHDKQDEIIPYTNSLDIFNSLDCNPDAYLWLTDGAGHIGSLETYTDEYLEKIGTFLDKYLSD